MSSGQGVPALRLIGLVLLVVVLRGCAAHRVKDVSPQACLPVAQKQLAAGVHAEALAGQFRLTLVAADGPRAGASVGGDLALTATDSANRVVKMPGTSPRTDAERPLLGTAAIALEDVGAVRVGDLASSDPSRPGVVVLERRKTLATDSLLEITLRFGSEANATDVQRFDGGFTALYVQDAHAGGFRGTWSSGVRSPTARGHFCAVRVTSAEG